MKSCLRAALIVFAIGSVCGGVPAQNADGAGCALEIHVDGLRNARGVVGTLLFTTGQGWPDDVSKSYRHKAGQIDAAAKSAVITYERLAPGNYGIVALHDENSNMKLDRNFLGIPKEGFGFANNPKVGFGPPSFAQATIAVTCPATHTAIHIQYK